MWVLAQETPVIAETPDWFLALGLLVSLVFLAMAIYVMKHLELGGPWL